MTMHFKPTVAASLMGVLTAGAAMADKVPVTLENYKVAESDLAFANVVDYAGGSNTWYHPAGLIPLDKQGVIRMNRDTVYSSYIADVSKGGTITLPDTGDRYISAMIVQNDHYIDQVFTAPGTHEIEADTDFVLVNVRIQINPNDPNDLDKISNIQDQLVVETGSKNDHVLPDYDMDQLLALRKDLISEATELGSLKNTQGARGEVDDHMHLLGTATGWGLLPDENAQYLSFFSSGVVADPETCSTATYSQPPMNEGGFFSITIYREDGYIDTENSNLNKYNIEFNEDETFTAHFGNCPEGVPNHLPTTENWDILFRVYEPKLEEMKAFTLPEPQVLG